ncbi:MAG: hypothetical protein PHN78_07630 [Dehalococcoidales bacterium]|nr:hypothetical protein [Dehalococcoidales bacterium]
MNKKIRLYVGLLVLGLALVGGGVWLLHSSAQAKVSIPEGTPVIYEKLDYIMRGQFSYLYIYKDGSIVLVEEKGLRLPSPGHPPTRTWKTGKLTSEQLDSLIDYLKNSGLNKLEERYQFPGQPIEGGPAGGFTMGDMGFTLIVKSGDLNKTVTAFGYLTSDQGETYPDMPSPLNDVFIRLRAIALAAQEVYRENIPQ